MPLDMSQRGHNNETMAVVRIMYSVYRNRVSFMHVLHAIILFSLPTSELIYIDQCYSLQNFTSFMDHHIPQHPSHLTVFVYLLISVCMFYHLRYLGSFCTLVGNILRSRSCQQFAFSLSDSISVSQQVIPCICHFILPPYMGLSIALFPGRLK